MKSTTVKESQVECKTVLHLGLFISWNMEATVPFKETGSFQGFSSDNNWSTSPNEPEFPSHCDPYAPSRTFFLFLDTPFSKVDLAKYLYVNLIHHIADFEHMIYLLQSK